VKPYELDELEYSVDVLMEPKRLIPWMNWM